VTREMRETRTRREIRDVDVGWGSTRSVRLVGETERRGYGRSR
jgi:hypothetical protein